jgi:hypothetical protein
MDELYVGIDLAISKHKRLPIAACEAAMGRIGFLKLRREFPRPPVGIGNAGALDVRKRANFVAETMRWLRELERLQGRSIVRIAIDAPSAPCREGCRRRLAELGLDRAGISCFSTPTRSEFHRILIEAQEHLDQGGAVTHMPHANKIWMLVGFDLFAEIRAEWECIEVYPQAIARSIGEGHTHKATVVGFAAQRQAFARVIGLSDDKLKVSLDTSGFGAAHDRLDAMMGAWVASLPDQDRIAYGNGTNDAIWIPRPRTTLGSAPLSRQLAPDR